MPTGGGAAAQVTQGGAFEALESADGTTIYFSRRIRSGSEGPCRGR